MTDADRRDEDARRRQELADAARSHEAAEAQKLIAEFVAEARRRGVPTEPLQATLYSGKTAKTDKRGWYLNRSRSLAIGEDGRYYSLVLSGSAWARLTGVKLEASAPSLQVGRGARDGESGDLQDFLLRVLSE